MRGSHWLKIALTLTGAAVTAGASGCTTWAHQSGPPSQVVEQQHAGPIRVTRTDHSVITVRDAQVVGDSLIGVTDDDARLHVAMPMTAVESVDTRRVSAARTVGLGFGIMAGVLALFGIVVAVALANVTDF